MLELSCRSQRSELEDDQPQKSTSKEQERPQGSQRLSLKPPSHSSHRNTHIMVAMASIESADAGGSRRNWTPWDEAPKRQRGNGKFRMFGSQTTFHTHQRLMSLEAFCRRQGPSTVKGKLFVSLQAAVDKRPPYQVPGYIVRLFCNGSRRKRTKVHLIWKKSFVEIP